MALMKMTVTSPEQAETSMTAAQGAPSTNRITPSVALANARKIADFKRLCDMAARMQKDKRSARHI